MDDVWYDIDSTVWTVRCMVCVDGIMNGMVKDSMVCMVL